MFPQLLALVAVFSLLGITLWWLKTKGVLQLRSLPYSSSGSNKPVNILQQIESVRLSPTHSLNLVRMADRAILIGISPGGFYLVESSSWKTLTGSLEVSK